MTKTACLYALAVFLLAGACFFPVLAEAQGRIVEITSTTPEEISLKTTEPAAHVRFKGWYCEAEKYREDTASVIRDFNHSKSWIMKKAEYQLKRAGDRAAKIIRRSGKGDIAFFTAQRGIQRLDKGSVEYYQRMKKITPDFFLDPSPGEATTMVKHCYSKAGLAGLMKLQVKAARGFLDAVAEAEKSEGAQ